MKAIGTLPVLPAGFTAYPHTVSLFAPLKLKRVTVGISTPASFAALTEVSRVVFLPLSA